MYLVGLHIHYKMIHGPYNINVISHFEKKRGGRGTGDRELSPRAKSDGSMKLATHLHLVPQWRKCGTLLFFPHTFTAKTALQTETSKQAKSVDKAQKSVER